METDTLQSSLLADPETGNFVPVSNEITVAIVVAVFLLLISLVLNSAEKSCFIAGITENQQKKRQKINKRFLKMLENQDTMKPVFVILKSIVNLMVIFAFIPVTNWLLQETGQPVLTIVFQVLIIVSVLVLSGEIIPQILAYLFPVIMIRIATWPLVISGFIFQPAGRLFNAIIIHFRNKKTMSRKTISMEDITQALKMSKDPGLEEDKEILEGIVRFGNKSVADIMKPRVDVVSLEIKTGFSAVLNLVVNSGFSRIPVYSGSFDNIKGVLYIKDILPHSHKGNSFNWQTLIRPPFYVPETKKINSLLGEFQKNKVHLAIVIDEYGGTSGIVTLEDVLEEIVGDIVDEFDEDDNYFSQIDEKTWLFDGKTLLVDFIKTTNIEESDFEEIKGDAETLAGLILELKGAIPQLGEKIVHKQYTFTIEEADERRIKKIKTEIDKN